MGAPGNVSLFPTPTWGDADDPGEGNKSGAVGYWTEILERAETLINEMIQETRKLVEQHWPEIEALAKRLLVKQRVNFLETPENPAS